MRFNAFLFLALLSFSASSAEPNAYPEKSQQAAKKETYKEMFKKASFLTEISNTEEALPLWRKLVAMNPGDAMAHAKLGFVLTQRGEIPEGTRQIQESLRLNPRLVEGHKYMGFIYMTQNKVPQAVQSFRTAMKYDPNKKCDCGALEKQVRAANRPRSKNTSSRHH